MVTDPPLTTENPWGDGSGSGMGMGMGMGDSGSGVDMMTQMVGRSGPKLLTNGQDGIDLASAPGKLERVRIVNGTASTRLQFTWSGDSMLQLASEGGRLGAAVTVPSIELAPGERTELVLVPEAGVGQLSAQRLSNEGSGGAQTSRCCPRAWRPATTTCSPATQRWTGAASSPSTGT